MSAHFCGNSPREKEVVYNQYAMHILRLTLRGSISGSGLVYPSSNLKQGVFLLNVVVLVSENKSQGFSKELSRRSTFLQLNLFYLPEIIHKSITIKIYMLQVIGHFHHYH